MRRRLRTDADIEACLQQLLRQARQHAPELVDVLAPLAERWRARHVAGRDRIDVYESHDGLLLAWWLRIDGQRYVLSHDATGVIHLRLGSIRSRPLKQFGNSFGRSMAKWMGLG